MQSIDGRHNVPLQPGRTETNDGRPPSTLVVANSSQRFRRHEEVLVVRGWQWLEWSAGAQQCISIVRTPDGSNHRHLTSSEFELASLVALGFAVKPTAADLGLGWATARTRINRALRKLGFRSAAQLPALWHALSGVGFRSRRHDGSEVLVFELRLDEHARAISLTSAERDVLQAVLWGHTNQQIARQRNTSVRTVANQLATLFQKFGASSKTELAARALRLMVD